MIDDAFVFDCVAHVFNFDPKNAFGQPGLMFDNHLYAFHNALTPDDQAKLPPEEFLRQWTPSDIRKMVYEESDTDMLVAMPLPLTDLFHDGLSPWESCAELASRDPDRTIFWGSVNPLEGRKALDQMERQVGEFGARAFKFYNVRYDYGIAVPVADGRPEHRLPHLREGAGTRREPDRRAQGGPARPAADRAHPDLGHGRGGRQLPRHQLRHLPRRAAVPRRDLLAADQVPEPVRVDRGDDQLRGPGAADVRGDPGQAALLVRRGQDHLRLGGAAVPPAVGAAGVHGLPDPRGPVRRLRLPAAHRPGQAQDPRREPAAPARPGCRRKRRPGCQRSPRGSNSGGKSW